MYSWVNRFRWCSMWKWALPCLVQGESSERVGGLTNFPLWKNIDFFIGNKNMKQLASFTNPSLLSWKIILWMQDYIFNANHLIFTVNGISTLLAQQCGLHGKDDANWKMAPMLLKLKSTGTSHRWCTWCGTFKAEGHFTYKPRAVTMKLWELKRSVHRLSQDTSKIM